MTKQEKLTFRILASLYPDRRPSEIRKIIDDALAKDERPDDIELWAILTKEKSEVIDTKKEPEGDTINNVLDGSISCASCTSATSDSAFVTLTI